jgi:hypothetical protein
MGFDVKVEIERILAEAKKEREVAWAENRNNPPKPPEWKREWDEVSGRMSGEMPFCPNCHEPLYEPEQCFFCGQPIQRDEKMDEFEKPHETLTMDCFRCGGVGTVQYTESKYNGHKSGGCTKCGMRFIE